MNHLKHRVISAVCSITLLSGTFSLPVFAADANSSESTEAISQTSETAAPTELHLPNLLIQLLQILHLAHRRLTQMLRLKVTTGKFNPIPGLPGQKVRKSLPKLPF